MRRSDELWLSAFGLGFIFTFAVAFVPPGIGLFVFMNALIACLWYFGAKNETSKELSSTKVSSWLVNIFAVFYVVLTVPLLYRLNIPILVMILFTQAVILFFGALYFALPSALHIVDLFSLIISPVVLGITWIVESVKSVIELFKENSNMVKLILKVILYFALSLFVFIMFARLLAQADAEFKSRIEYVLDSLRLSEIMGRMVWGVVLSFVAAGLLTIIGTMKVLPLFGTTVERAKVQWEKAFSVVFSKRSDAILPIVVTLPLLLLFGLYVWVQFTYLFGHDMSAILAKYSFAEYAHRGFVELLVVAMLTYPLLSWSMNQSKSEWSVPRYASFVVNTGIVGLLVVMLYSLLLRMNIYLQNYGPSVLRLYVIVGAVFVGIVLVVYEAFAIAKAIKPGFSLMKGRFFGDYTIAGMIVGLSLITTLAVVPWDSIVVNQLTAYYKKTGNVDIFQLVQLPIEVQPKVYKFADQLTADGITEGALVVRAHAVKVSSDYSKSRKVSFFTNIFGFNVAGQQLLNTVPVSTLTEVTDSLDKVVNNKITATSSKFINSLVANDFATAREVYDPQMKANDIKAFASNIAVSRDYSAAALQGKDAMNYYSSGLIDGYQKSVYSDIPIRISRSRTGQQTAPVTAQTTGSVSLTYSFRNGKLVVVNSSLVLSYLPDAVNATNTDTYNNNSLIAYGYRTFCKVPNLDVLYSSDNGCSASTTAKTAMDYASPEISAGMPPFVQSDFVTTGISK